MVLLRHKPWSWLTLKCTPVFILFLIFFFVGLKWNLSPGTAAYCNVCMSVHCRHWRDKAWNGHIGQMDTHTHTQPTDWHTHTYPPTNDTKTPMHTYQPPLKCTPPPTSLPCQQQIQAIPKSWGSPARCVKANHKNGTRQTALSLRQATASNNR